MSIKMKKSDLAITASILTLILAGVLAGLAGCQIEGISTPATGEDTGGTPPPGYTNPRIEIYGDDTGNVNRAGKELTWQYDSSASTHPKSTHTIEAKVFGAPAGYDYQEWTISPPAAVTGGIVDLPSGFADRRAKDASNPVYKTVPLANGSFFEFRAGAVVGNARVTVRNTDRDGRYGALSAYIDIRVVEGGALRPLTVYVTETIRVSNPGLVRVSRFTPPPTWSVRSGNAAVSLISQQHTYSGADSEYHTVVLDVTGMYAGYTTYFARGLQGANLLVDAKGDPVYGPHNTPIYQDEGTMVDTEGTLQVIASTTWYVGPGAAGKYGFRDSDKINWTKCLLAMYNYYTSSPSKWPLKGFGSEQHGIIRLTGSETGGLGFSGTGFPANIDLVNDSPQAGQKTLSGVVTVGAGKTLTLNGIKTTGSMTIDSGAQVTMAPAEINGPLIVSGTLAVTRPDPWGSGGIIIDVPANPGVVIMQDGILSSSSTRVLSGGRLTINAGTINGNTKIDVATGGSLTIKRGTVIAYGAQVYRNGAALTTPLTVGVLTADFTLTP